MSLQRYPLNPGEELSGTAGKDFVARGGDERAVGRVGLDPRPRDYEVSRAELYANPTVSKGYGPLGTA